MLQFFYGVDERYTDITRAVFDSCSDGDRIYIRKGDIIRGKMFTDPAYGAVKGIVVIREEGDGTRSCASYGPNTEVNIPLTQEEKKTQHTRDPQVPPHLPTNLSSTDEKINYLHSRLKFAGANEGLEYELPEQEMIVDYLDPKAKVLEIGANIGRSTLTIASVLEDPSNLVSLECDPESAELLRNNRFANGFDSHIEPSAISYRKLIQKGWMTIPSDELLPGYQWIQTITFEELVDKYGIEFDTLFADCEGALYYILNDSKELLRNIKTIILEADFAELAHKQNVEATFAEFGLKKVFSERLDAAWATWFPQEIKDSFFEVWKKD